MTMIKMVYRKKFISGLMEGMTKNEVLSVDEKTYNDFMKAEKEHRVFRPAAGLSMYIVENVHIERECRDWIEQEEEE